MNFDEIDFTEYETKYEEHIKIANEYADKLEKEIAKEPNNTKVRNNLAISLMEANRYQEAFLHFEEAAKRNPNVQSLFNLAYFYSTEGKPIIDKSEEEAYSWEIADDEAFELLKKVVELNPQHHFPYNLMGEMYIKKEKYETAITFLKQAISYTPSLENLHNLGVCYYKKGMIGTAVDYFSKAHALRSERNLTLWPMLCYGVCLAQLGRKEEAKAIAKEMLILSEKEEQEFQSDIAEIYYFIDDYKEFVKEYSQLDWVFYSVEYLPPYFYSLWKLGQSGEIEKLAAKIIANKEKQIEEVLNDPEECDDFDKVEYEAEIREEIAFVRKTVQNVYAGIRPTVRFEPYLETSCYFYGCFRHNNPNPNY
ncbi:tetratricopeptide repeat protein [Priestia megaterium]|uniref:tetratricopeptide repeat protein n=1 Tax=Priestia megaterium TaxID=1404 RepID=UPI002E246003|nr:tetratricopeptide repeat protein [Priestia megaterium]